MKHYNYKIWFICFLTILPAIQLSPHNNEHNDSTQQQVSSSAANPGQAETSHSEEVTPSTAVFKSYGEFPNLHPMVVHFPIVLLLIAFASQLAGFFVFREQLSWITQILLAGGLVGAIFASNIFHPHTSALPANLEQVLETHEWYAALTIWLALVALVFKTISHFWLKRKMWAELIVLLFLAGSASTVSLAAHLGGQMVHIENIGPKGNYLKQHED